MLVGRDFELAAIEEVIASARSGRGRALFVTGEAGIGKSSVLGEVRGRASGVVLEGAAWESPGAPPYWPWRCVLRAAAAHGVVDPIDQVGVLEGAAARFAVVDAVAQALVALAMRVGLVVIVVDDLHAADLPSLELVDRLAREIPRAPIALVGAWREGELAARPEAARHLARAARGAIVAPLKRLSEAEVRAWIGVGGGGVARDIYTRSEGNPLFVEELVRARASGHAAVTTIAAVLDDHLALVSADCRAALAGAAILGRAFDPAIASAVVGADLDAALAEAERAAIGAREADDRWRFRHVLLRDHLVAQLPPARRTALHRAAGEVLATRAPGSIAAAHHLLAAAPDARAIAVAREAAARALAVHAFEDAVALLAAAARALPTDPTTRIDVLLELCRARHLTGDREGGQADALRAAELARGDPERQARAALAYATELVSGRRDPAMIELLENALAVADPALRVRVMARLAAAYVPTPGPDPRPFALADEAVALAADLDDDTRLFVLRFASHARGLMGGGLASEIEQTRGVIALADRVGRPLEALDHRAFAINALLSAGDVAGAEAEIAALAELVERIPLPHYRWRIPVVRAMRAVQRGAFDEAARLVAIVRRIASDHDLDRARGCGIFAAIGLALTSRDAAYADALVDDVRTFARTVGAGLSTALTGAVLAAAGRLDEARADIAKLVYLPPISLSQLAAEGALIVDDRDVMARARTALLAAIPRGALAVGPGASLALCPLAITLGELHARLGDPAAARASLERGLAEARALAAPPFVARAEAALALAHARPAAPIASARDDAAAVSPLAIRCADDLAHVTFRRRAHRFPLAKGFEYLAALVARENREVHVSELVGDDDRGDAGEILDATARAAYKARADELRAELALAEARNDLGRIDRATAELDALTEQLVAASGLGGRPRRAKSHVERARVNVQRRLRDAILKIAAADPDLGRYLEANVRTGTFCVFRNDAPA